MNQYYHLEWLKNHKFKFFIGTRKAGLSRYILKKLIDAGLYLSMEPDEINIKDIYKAVEK